MAETAHQDDPHFRDAQRQLRRLRRLGRVLIGILVACLALLVYLAARFPFAAMPALIGASLGYWQLHAKARRRPRRTLGSIGLSDGRAFLWALLSGAIGYATFAALGIGVPAPEAPLAWRLFGGAVFGSVAGVGAWWFLGTIVDLWAHFNAERGAA